MARIKNSLKANYKDGFLKDFFLTTPYFKQSLWFLYKFVKRDCCQWRFWKILLCEMWVTWHYLSADHPRQYGHFLPTTTTSFMRPGCGWERRGRSTTLRYYSTTTTTTNFMRSGCDWERRGRLTTLRYYHHHHHPIQPSCGRVRQTRPQEDAQQRLVVQSLSTRLEVLILLAFWTIPPDLVFWSEVLLVTFYSCTRAFLNVQ